MAARRLFFYTYGAFGLGHLRRVLNIAGRLATVEDPPETLIATNSAQTRAFALPPRGAFLPLPPLIRDIFDREPNKYRSFTPHVSVADAFKQRAEAIRSVLDDFRPDLVFVDHGATGAEREVMPLLDEIATRKPSARPRLVLGLRDIYGSLEWTLKDWGRLGAFEVLDLYDLVLVFGDETILTTAQEMDLAGRLPGKVHHTGYLGRKIGSPRFSTEARSGSPAILVTAGGGNDALPFLNDFANYVEKASPPLPFRFQVVPGPFLSRGRNAKLKDCYMRSGHSIELMLATRRMDRLLAEAAGVLAMGGYNTVVEIICASKPALVIPRKSPSEEQVLRARRLCPRAGLSYCLPGQPVVPAIDAFVRRLSEGPIKEDARVDLGGLDRTAQLIRSLFDDAG